MLVSFEDLAKARFRLLASADADAESEYQEISARFQEINGRIIHAAWTTSVAGGAVVTSSWRTRLARLLGLPGQSRLHSFTDYVGARDPEILLQVTRAETLVSLCEEVLRGSSQRVALAHVHTVLRQLFAISDAKAQGNFDDLAMGTALRAANIGLTSAEYLYVDLSEQSAQIFYFWGMMLGALLVAVVAALAALVVPDFADAVWGLKINEYESAVSFGALAAGALGAQISVMWRMTSGSFSQVAVFGPENLRRLGTFRPFIGAIFGLIFYFALKAGLVSSTYVPKNASVYFYLFTAFLAGFSERLVPEFLGDKEQDAKADGKRPPTASAPSPPTY